MQDETSQLTVEYRSYPDFLERPPRQTGADDELPATDVEPAGTESGSRSALDLSIVIPAFNEARRLIGTLTSIRTYLARANVEYEVIVVSDGCTDATLESIAELLSLDRRYSVAVHARNQGKGAAVCTGVARSSGDRILVMDADASSPIEEWTRLAGALDAGGDIAIGSRSMRSADTSVERRPSRMLTGRVFRSITWLSTGLVFRDTQCGFKLFDGKVGRELFRDLRSSGFEFDVELLALARERGLRVSEVAINWKAMEGSTVRVARDAPRMLRGLLWLANRHLPTVLDRQLVVVSILCCVLFALAVAWLSFRRPLFNTTEERYAASAAEMASTDDWTMPRVLIDDAWVPFWGKPPLQTWMTAMSLNTFGRTEWAARVPGLIAGALLIMLVVVLGRRLFGAATGWLAAAIVASSLTFFVHWGAVILDTTSAALVTLAFTSFLFAIDCDLSWKTRWFGYVFFLALGLELLAKGPILVIFTLVPIGIWSIWTRSHEWRRLPIWTGIMLVVAVAAPWYLLAEMHSPGFLQYFFINEHILRFLRPDYGDLYGSAHVYPRGTIWGMLLLGILPWPLIVFGWKSRSEHAVRSGHSVRSGHVRSLVDREIIYLLLLWGLCPGVFFTMARSISPTYVLPGIGGIAILAAVLIRRAFHAGRLRYLGVAMIGVPGIAMLAAAAVASIVVLERPVGSLLCVVLAATVVALSWHAYRARAPVAQLGVSLSCVAIAWVTLYGVLGDDLDRRFSVRGVVRRGLEVVQGGEGRLIACRAKPAMAFYGGERLLALAREDVDGWMEHVCNGVADVYIFKPKYLTRLDPGVANALRLDREWGDYGLYLEREPCKMFSSESEESVP